MKNLKLFLAAIIAVSLSAPFASAFNTLSAPNVPTELFGSQSIASSQPLASSQSIASSQPPAPTLFNGQLSVFDDSNAAEAEITVVVTNADGTTTRRPATEGETIAAGAGESVTLEFSDGSTVALAANSSVSVSNISSTASGDIQVNVGYGKVSYNVPVARTAKKIAISTPLGTAEVSEGSGEVELGFEAGEVTLAVRNNNPSSGGVQIRSNTSSQTNADGTTTTSFASDAPESTSDVGSNETVVISAPSSEVAGSFTPEDFSTLVSGQNTPTPTPTQTNNPFTGGTPVTESTDGDEAATNVASPAGEA